MKTYFPDYPRPDNWKEHDRITDCYFADWAFEGTSIQCIVEQGIVGKDEDQHEYYKLYACYDHMLLTLWGWGTYDTALLSRLALEKVTLPSEKEAQDRIDAREKADSEAAAAAEEEARLGTPQELKFVPTQEELLTFMAMVYEKTYPAEGDRGQGLLSPLVGAVRAEGYLLLPYMDGEPAEPTEGYCTACSLHIFDMPACSVEGFHAGKDNKLYAYFVRYPSTEEAELLMQGIETFKQSRQGHTVNLKTWKDSGFIKDYREVTFTLNGEEQTGFATVCESSTKLEFFYDGKLITLTCAEEGADSFDLSLFEHLTLEKVPLPE
ncbi:MAG: hypothetical protein VB086_03015 [Clostridiaceae bacterium]|nr:hypothetical protein [Clostridiaceae bacterium]